MEKGRKSELAVFTGESIASVIAGLDLKETDDVWSVGKNGDIAFAMLPRVHSVAVSERRKEQQDLILKKRRMLEEKDYNNFIYLNAFYGFNAFAADGPLNSLRKAALQRRNDYFHPVRLDEISDKLSEFKGSFNLLPEGYDREDAHYSKKYLSDIVEDSDKFIDIQRELERHAKNLAPGSLMYICNHVVLSMPHKYYINPSDVQKIKNFKGGAVNSDFYSPDVCKRMLPKCLELDTARTQKAWDYLQEGDKSTPAVYVKI
jgi:hypothetical protein